MCTGGGGGTLVTHAPSVPHRLRGDPCGQGASEPQARDLSARFTPVSCKDEELRKTCRCREGREEGRKEGRMGRREAEVTEQTN